MGVCFQHVRDFENLHQVEAAFTPLVFADEGLRPAESVGKGSLRQAPLRAGFSKQLPQLAVPRRKYGIRHWARE